MPINHRHARRPHVTVCKRVYHRFSGMDARVQRRHDEERIGLPLPRPGPKTATAFVWWVFGMYALFFAKGLTPTAESEQAFSEKMQEAVFSQVRCRLPEQPRS